MAAASSALWPATRDPFFTQSGALSAAACAFPRPPLSKPNLFLHYITSHHITSDEALQGLYINDQQQKLAACTSIKTISMSQVPQ
jgi:hypothetical protein